MVDHPTVEGVRGVLSRETCFILTSVAVAGDMRVPLAAAPPVRRVIKAFCPSYGSVQTPETRNPPLWSTIAAVISPVFWLQQGHETPAESCADTSTRRLSTISEA